MTEEPDVGVHLEPELGEPTQLPAAGTPTPPVKSRELALSAMERTGRIEQPHNRRGDCVGQKAVEQKRKRVEGGEEVKRFAAWPQQTQDVSVEGLWVADVFQHEPGEHEITRLRCLEVG